jgi:hypothetical protein
MSALVQGLHSWQPLAVKHLLYISTVHAGSASKSLRSALAWREYRVLLVA